MKKIFTLAAAALVGAVSFGASALDYNQQAVENISLKPEAAQRLRTMRAQNSILTKSEILGMEENGEAYTRSWVTTDGEWMLMATTEMERLVDAITASDENGNPVQLDFNDYPYYLANLEFYFFPKNSDNVSRGVTFVAAWPTYYLYSQAFAEGTFNIPVEDRDYNIVAPSELFNNRDYCHSFEETQGLGGNFDNTAGTWKYWFMLPNKQLGMTAVWNGAQCYTEYGSSLDFTSYDPNDSFTEVSTRVTLKEDGGTRSYNMRIRYSGTARVQGFEHVDMNLPEFGDLYLFNAGLTSSEMLGENTPFTEEFPEVSQLYMFVGDKLFDIWVDPNGGAFSPEKIALNRFNGTEEDLVGHENLVRGYLYGKPKYAKDTALDPSGDRYVLSNIRMELDPSTNEYYDACAPVVDSFVPYGYNYVWSSNYGMQVAVDGYYERLADDSCLGWGTTEGLVLNLLTVFDKSITAKSTGTVHYYYDPSDITKVRDFSTVGSAEWSGVENVVADGIAAKVYTRDGKIFVNADEAADVAVFTLDGKLVKSVKAAEVAVEAEKGVYVVCVGNKASKVVL